MKNKYIIIIYSLFLLFIVGCNKEIKEINIEKGIRINTSIEQLTSNQDVRSSNSLPFKKVFENGDKIGIEVINNNESNRYIYNLNNGVWESQNPLKINNDSKILAYFPIDENFIKNGVQEQSVENLTLKTIPIKANTSVKRGSKILDLHFYPSLSLILVKINSNQPITNIQAKVRTQFSFAQNEVITNNIKKSLSPQYIDGNTFGFIIPAQNIELNQEDKFLSFNCNNKIFKWQTKAIMTTAGVITKININIPENQENSTNKKAEINSQNGFLNLDFFKELVKDKPNHNATVIVKKGNTNEYYDLPNNVREWNNIIPIQDLDNSKLYIIYPGLLQFNINKDANQYNFETPKEQGQKEFFDYYNKSLYTIEKTADNKFSITSKPLFVKFKIHLESPDFTNEELSLANVNVFSFRDASLNLNDFSIKTDNNYDNIEDIKAYPVGNGEFEAMLYPKQSLARFGKIYNTGIVKVIINNYVYKFPLPEDILQKAMLNSGDVEDISFTIHKPDLTNFTNTTKWVKGIEAPNESDFKTEFIGTYANKRLKFCPWKPNQGWFAIMKFDPYNGKIYKRTDGNMCWAASACSQIAWWLDQNKNREGIGQYITQNNLQRFIPQPPILEDKSKLQNRTVYDLRESELYDEICKHFRNNGNYPKRALNFFIYGLSDDNGQKIGGGYLKNWLQNREIAQEVILTNRYNAQPLFNSTIRNALNDYCSISFYTNDHAMNIWGAHFDEYGNIDKLYIVDNNDFYEAYLGWGRIGMIEVDIVYKDEGVYIKNYDGDGRLDNIVNLTLLYRDPKDNLPID